MAKNAPNTIWGKGIARALYERDKTYHLYEYEDFINILIKQLPILLKEGNTIVFPGIFKLFRQVSTKRPVLDPKTGKPWLVTPRTNANAVCRWSEDLQDFVNDRKKRSRAEEEEIAKRTRSKGLPE